MKIEEIKNANDILQFMGENIEFGWMDCNGEKHIKTMKDFRKLYRTISIEDTIKHGVGTCIEQVYLMHYLFDKINIKNKMYCCRINKLNENGNLEVDEYMHNFLLYYENGKVYHIEHPNFLRTGIYEYDSEEEAINAIVEYYINQKGGKEKSTKEFFEVKPGLSFGEFNDYINSI